MRSTTLALTALLAGAAELVAADCAADNCLRALRATGTPGRLSSAQAFCATFTAATTSVAPTAVPTYAVDACKQNQNGDLNFRLSSACACIAPATTTVPSGPTAAACALVSSSWAAQKAAAPAGK